MIKAKMSTEDGRTIVLLGLSRENTTRLHANKPIYVTGAEMDVPVDIVIIAGETEEAIVTLLGESYELPPKSQWRANRD